MIASTPRDLGRLLVALLNSGHTEAGTPFLTPELVAEALRSQAPAESEFGGPTTYALGWEVDSSLGTTTIKKGGTVHTMASLLLLLPAQQTALAFTFNREEYKVLGLLPSVLAILAGGSAEPLQVPPASEAKPVKPANVAPAVLDRWVGRYDTRSGDVAVTRRGEALFADLAGGEVALLPLSDSSFSVATDVVGLDGRVITFRRQGAAVTLWEGTDSSGVRR
jgi:hypothetical protein